MKSFIIIGLMLAGSGQDYYAREFLPGITSKAATEPAPTPTPIPTPAKDPGTPSCDAMQNGLGSLTTGTITTLSLGTAPTADAAKELCEAKVFTGTNRPGRCRWRISTKEASIISIAGEGTSSASAAPDFYSAACRL
jgi:hypothetical protein